MEIKKNVLLKGIADLIIMYENPTESNQEKVIGAYLEIDNEFYEYDGEKFVKQEKKEDELYDVGIECLGR